MATEPTPTLEPCPFCGDPARHLPGKSGYWLERVICDTCHFHLLETGIHTAVERWNRRAQPAPAASPVPLTDPQLVACIKAAGFKTWDSRMWALKREIESLHGITKGA